MARAVPAIEAVGLSKRFGEATAVQQLSFTVQPGEVFGFLGPNGAGKTTTVRMLIGLLAPSEGTARLLGETAGASDDLRRRIGVMTETPGLYESLTVEENLAYFADLHSVTGPHRRARLDACLERAGLSDRRDDRADALSKGLKQRAALARALVGDPEILFLDEPTAGPGGFRRGAKVDRKVAPVGGYRVSHHPPFGGGGPRLRPGGHYQHPSAYHRPPR